MSHSPALRTAGNSCRGRRALFHRYISNHLRPKHGFAGLGRPSAHSRPALPVRFMGRCRNRRTGERRRQTFYLCHHQAKQQASITAQAVAALSQHGRVAQAFVADRVAYAAAMTGGNTAPEVAAKGHAAEEIAALWHELKSV